MKSKYIIIEMNKTEMPLVFSPFLSHEDVVVAGQKNVKSAGYCELDVAGKWAVSGESVSLKLHARPQDTEILNAHLSDTFKLHSAKRTATTR